MPLTPAQRGQIDRVRFELAAVTAYQAGRFAVCGEQFAALIQRDPAQAIDHTYWAAACYARGGDSERAFHHLTELVGLGFRDRDVLSSDDDFRTLRSDPRWRGLLQGMQKK